MGDMGEGVCWGLFFGGGCFCARRCNIYIYISKDDISILVASRGLFEVDVLQCLVCLIVLCMHCIVGTISSIRTGYILRQGTGRDKLNKKMRRASKLAEARALAKEVLPSLKDKTYSEYEHEIYNVHRKCSEKKRKTVGFPLSAKASPVVGKKSH